MSKSKSPSHHGFMDRLGASLSVACALHCALQPLLLLALPFLGLSFLLNEQAETIFLICSALLASFSLVQGHQHHGRSTAFPVLALSLALIIASRLPGLSHMEMILAVTGALGIASAHGINMYLHRQFHQIPQTPKPIETIAELNSAQLPLENFSKQEALSI